MSLQKYQQDKEHLLSWYEKISKNTLLHTKEHNRETILSKGKQLRDEKFIVAICGEMKAGKSTLMNALLFEDEILPSSPTTMTAKVTLIEGAQKEGLKATFYNKKEWASVVQSAHLDENSREELIEARENARDAGIDESQIIATHPIEMNKDHLKELVQFVGVPDDGGLYTPYVNSVVIQADLPWLHEVTVADTPGTNDPNPERDKVTKEWIQQADAVIYVTYAGQAGMNQEDADFLDKYLLHVPTERKILAVNKCDTIDDVRSIESHLRGVAENDIRLRDFLKGKDQIAMVSGLAGLIQTMRSKDRELSEELSYELPKLEKKGWLSPEKNGVDRLRNLIEKRLIQNKGEGLILSHRTFIQSLFEKAIRDIEEQKNTHYEEIEDVSASHEERLATAQKIHEFISKMNKVKDENDKKLSKVINDAGNSLDKEMERIRQRIGDAVAKDIADISKKKLISSTVPWIIKDKFEKNKHDIIKHMSRLEVDHREYLEKYVSDLESELKKERLFIQRRKILIFIPTRQIMAKVFSQLDTVVEKLDFKKIIKKFDDYWPSSFFGSPTSAMLTALKNHCGEICRNILKEELISLLQQELYSCCQKYLHKISGDVTKILQKRKDYLELLQDEAQEINIEIQNRKQLIEGLDQKIAQLRSEEQEFLKLWNQ